MATKKVLSEVKAALDRFEPVSLEEMDRVKLMDRTDLKYNFNIRHLPEFLDLVRNDYRVLEVSGTRMSRYETLYFDTPGFDLFRTHHRGIPTRFKIRSRTYVESDLNFFEVKHKNNKGRTIKVRVKKHTQSTEISGNAEELLQEKTGMTSGHLEPKMWVNYTRVTLVNKRDEERLTIDLDLLVKNETRACNFDGLVIVEAKLSKYMVTPFIKLLKENHMREGGMSKYCMAVMKLAPEIKANNFKEKLLQVNKIVNETNVA